ncbi:MAG: hypothetical protein U0R49_08160 [Fimbriimonadales bacterium]
MREEPQTPYPRQEQPVVANGKFPGDMVVGIFVLVIYGCCTALTALGMMGAGSAAARAQSGPAIQSIISTLATVSILIAGIGITLSKKWGFILALIGSIVHTVLLAYAISTVPTAVAESARQQPSPLSEEAKRFAVTMGYGVLGFMILMQLLLLLYCYLRLSRKVGPPPLD